MKLFRFEINGGNVDVLASSPYVALHRALRASGKSDEWQLTIVRKKVMQSDLDASPLWQKYAARKLTQPPRPQPRHGPRVGERGEILGFVGTIKRIEGDFALVDFDYLQQRVEDELTQAGSEDVVGHIVGFDENKKPLAWLAPGVEADQEFINVSRRQRVEHMDKVFAEHGVPLDGVVPAKERESRVILAKPSPEWQADLEQRLQNHLRAKAQGE